MTNQADSHHQSPVIAHDDDKGRQRSTEIFSSAKKAPETAPIGLTHQAAKKADVPDPSKVVPPALTTRVGTEIRSPIRPPVVSPFCAVPSQTALQTGPIEGRATATVMTEAGQDVPRSTTTKTVGASEGVWVLSSAILELPNTTNHEPRMASKTCLEIMSDDLGTSKEAYVERMVT